MIIERPENDPERIGRLEHPDDCDCERCFPTVCVDCGEDTERGNSLCRQCQAIEDGHAGVVE